MRTRIIGSTVLPAMLATIAAGRVAKRFTAGPQRPGQCPDHRRLDLHRLLRAREAALEGRRKSITTRNAAHTANGLARLDEWLAGRHWDVIHFNHGLHDMKYINASGARVDPSKGVQQVSVEVYARNLDELVRRLKKTRATLIFATTTPVPDGAMGRVRGDAERYNRAALPVMKRHRVRVNDLMHSRCPGSTPSTPRVHHGGRFRLLAEQVGWSNKPLSTPDSRQSSGSKPPTTHPGSRRSYRPSDADTGV
jgi:hypothetical protein